MDTPQKAILLARISDARNGDSHGVDGQLKDLRQWAGRLGWATGPAATHEIIENDTSAFKRRRVCPACLQPARECRCPAAPAGRKRATVLRTWRPGFRRALEMLADGTADGLIALDLDRACRDPRDLEDLIDVVKSRYPLIPVDSVTGSLRLANDADIAMARVMVAMANKSSSDTARRVADRRRLKAAEGIPGGGTRCFGYTADGMQLVPAEAQEITAAADAVLAGATLRAVARDWNERGLTTPWGLPWRGAVLRGLLLRPRLAGIMVYQGQEAGAAAWPPVLDEAAWRSVRQVLTGPGRNHARGNEVKWLGSGLYLCGACGATAGTGTGGKGGRSYVCPAHHVRRTAAEADRVVVTAVTARLALPDAALTPPDAGSPDVAALHREAAVLRARLDEQATLHAEGEITGAQLATGSAKLAAKLAAVESQLSTAAARSPLEGIAGRADAAAVWETLPLWRRRGIVDALVEVRLLPARPGRQRDGSYFDPESVKIDWKADV
jgi:DNA invertase Pin-like site-specific DNA recombinase